MFSRLVGALKGSPATAASMKLHSPPSPTTNIAQQAQAALSSAAQGKQEIFTGANGCFWGTEHEFRTYFTNHGLIDAKVGFIGGKESNKKPSYEEVCTGRTGHAEACQVKYDPSKVSYAEMVEFFYRTHDPTTKDRQGNDRGTQYRSAIFANSPEQLDIVKKVTAEVQAKHFDPKGQKIVTQIEERRAEDFVEADDYHQKYLINNPSGYQCSTHRLWW